jgi:hypothetical protein
VEGRSPWTYGTSVQYGLFYKYVAANGTTVTASYNSNEQPTTETITNARDPGASVQYVFGYTPTSGPNAVTNALVTSTGGTVPQLVSSITLQQRSSSTDTWHVVRTANYTYYNGDGTDNAGNSVNVDDGRLGDLEQVTITDLRGSIVTQDYYRYYKLTGDAYDSQSAATSYVPPPSPTNVPETTGGPSPLELGYGSDGVQGHANTNNPYMDDFVFSGLKTVVQGPSLDRLAAAVPNFRTSTDDAIKPYVDNFYSYERWNDHDGADGIVGWGAPGDSSNTDINWLEAYGASTGYRVTQEVAQGQGCSSCTAGEGTYKYDYAANFSVFSDDPNSIVNTSPNMNMGYGTIEYNDWRMKLTEYLPDDTPTNWADNNREVIYTNEVGQPMLEDFVQVTPTSSSISSITGVNVDSYHSLITVNAPNNFTAGQYVAITGVLPELYDGVFKVASATSTSFAFSLSENYYGNNSESGSPPPAAWASGNTPAPGSTSVQGYVSAVTSQSLTYFRYDDQGRQIEAAQPSAVTGYDDSKQDLVDTATTPLGLI